MCFALEAPKKDTLIALWIVVNSVFTLDWGTEKFVNIGCHLCMYAVITLYENSNFQSMVRRVTMALWHFIKSLRVYKEDVQPCNSILSAGSSVPTAYLSRKFEKGVGHVTHPLQKRKRCIDRISESGRVWWGACFVAHRKTGKKGVLTFCGWKRPSATFFAEGRRSIEVRIDWV
jgi:hypothetical protein